MKLLILQAFPRLFKILLLQTNSIFIMLFFLSEPLMPEKSAVFLILLCITVRSERDLKILVNRMILGDNGVAYQEIIIAQSLSAADNNWVIPGDINVVPSSVKLYHISHVVVAVGHTADIDTFKSHRLRKIHKRL